MKIDVDLTYTTGSEKKLVQIQMQCYRTLHFIIISFKMWSKPAFRAPG